jgi:L-alanine-DL-glutamate epimerase-like enolase superfamily enzyme
MDEHGMVSLPTRPGLGEDINFAYIEANTVSHD